MYDKYRVAGAQEKATYELRRCQGKSDNMDTYGTGLLNGCGLFNVDFRASDINDLANEHACI